MPERILRSRKGIPRHVRKEQQWRQIEFTGRVGFLGFKHQAAFEKKLMPVMPQILQSIRSNNKPLVLHRVFPISAELTTTFALMALQVRSKAKRRHAYSLMKHIAMRDCEKDYVELRAEDSESLKNIFGSKEKAEDFWRIFGKNYAEIVSASSAIINREWEKQQQK